MIHVAQIYGGPWDGSLVPRAWKAQKVEVLTLPDPPPGWNRWAVYYRDPEGNYYFIKIGSTRESVK